MGVKVMLRISPWKGIARFGKRCKLNQRYVGQFVVVARAAVVAYRLKLPAEPSERVGVVTSLHHSIPPSSTIKLIPSILSLLNFREIREKIRDKLERKPRGIGGLRRCKRGLAVVIARRCRKVKVPLPLMSRDVISFRYITFKRKNVGVKPLPPMAVVR
ncbi:hypothetical protein OSB04_008012 [Centaurea solstitialis]|uniref:Tf2-1-like SH3-like domain-containing protein n=1 Tax=Centaurea solstitialis TaxID=347529 RepID=A0AA38WJ19_9ASTR|nr:hypothetical protein OSB04_008012 [Centaurea solstitialis]